MTELCVCIPVFENPATIAHVVDDCLRLTPWPVIVVDDGSTIPVLQLLTSPLAKSARERGTLTVLRLERNCGKGVALMTAFRHAHLQGYTYAAALDGDGQHYAVDLANLVAAIDPACPCLVLGCRRMRPGVTPWISRLGRFVSNTLVWLATGVQPYDSQSGMRLYPLGPLLSLPLSGSRYEFELDVLLKLLWSGVRLCTVSVRVYYPLPPLRVSHFHKFWDNGLILRRYLLFFGFRLKQQLGFLGRA